MSCEHQTYFCIDAIHDYSYGVFYAQMDVLNKFCSTVSSTVSQLSGVLPGNPVTREYEVTDHIASAGPGENN